MTFKRAKTAPSPYPKLAFHGIRIGQALASLVVSAIMFYFIWHLKDEDYAAPKTFWTLLAASLLTLICLIGSAVVYACFGLAPLVSLIVNAVLFIMWCPGFGFLWYYSRGTLSHVCNRLNWVGPTGIMVCRIYKALFAFSMLGFATTLAALLLDIVIWRKTTSRGKYKQMLDPHKPQGIAPGDAPYTAPHYSDSRNSISLAGYTQGQQPRGDREGYEVPEEQFQYDTAYHGGHEPNEKQTQKPQPALV